MSPCHSILLLLLLFCIHIHASSSNQSSSSCNPNDLRALRALSQGLDIQIQGWPVANFDFNCCSWPGVDCSLLSTLSPSSNASLSIPARVVGLNLSGKGLQGVLLSPSLSGLDNLRFLNLSNNYLRGLIPPEMFHLKLLESLDLSGNFFSGELPRGIGNLTNLHNLDISNNQVTGIIPDEFHGLQKLQVLKADSNLLVGRLPISLSSCSNMTLLSLWNNSLEGSLGLDFRRLPLLTTLKLGWNKLSGVIPESLSACKSLRMLDLSRNNLNGQLPIQLGELQSLFFLELSDNYLSNISKALHALQKCRNLAYLLLSQNFQGEEMPINGIQGFPRARVLGFGNDSLTGVIPPWLRTCVELRALDLAWNYLSGEIPCWIGSFVHLFVLDLSHNLLGGEIPISLTQLKSLRLGITSQHDVSPSDPHMFSWVLGSPNSDSRIYKNYKYFPPVLNLSHNNLNGSIWRQFGNLRYTSQLDLSRNNLSGFIPEEMANMRSLEILDLSFNMLTGQIPSSVTQLTFLSEFDVAYNRLQGLIPSGGQFDTFSCSSYQGNAGLYSNSKQSCYYYSPSNLDEAHSVEQEEDEEFFIGLPFVVGLPVGFLPTVYFLLLGHKRLQDVVGIERSTNVQDTCAQFASLTLPTNPIMKDTAAVFAASSSPPPFASRRVIMQSLNKFPRSAECLR